MIYLSHTWECSQNSKSVKTADTLPCMHLLLHTGVEEEEHKRDVVYEHVEEALLTEQAADFLDDDPTPALSTNCRHSALSLSKDAVETTKFGSGGKNGNAAGLFDQVDDDGGDDWLQLSAKSSK